MKINIYKLVLIFAVFVYLIILDNSNLRKNLVTKLQGFEDQTIETIIEYTEDLIKFKKDGLYQIQKNQCNDETVKLLIDDLISSKNNDLKFEINDYYIYKKDDKIFSTNENRSKLSDFSEDEINTLNELYDRIVNVLSLEYASKWNSCPEGKELFFGLPVYDAHYKIYGICLSRITTKEIDEYASNIISNENIKTFVKINDEFISEDDQKEYEKILSGNTVINRAKNIENLYSIEIITNTKALCPSFYYSKIIAMILCAAIFALIIYASYKNGVTVPYWTAIVIAVMCIAGHIYEITQYKFYSNIISDVKVSAAANVFETNIELNCNANLSILYKAYQTIKDDIIKNNVGSDDAMDYVFNNEIRILENTVDKINYAGHAYIYDINRKMKVFPYEDNITFVQPDEKIYTEYAIHKDSQYIKIEYDPNYKSEVVYISYPIINKGKCVLIFTSVFDYTKLRLDILRKNHYSDMNLEYIDMTNNLYDANNGLLIFQKKYPGIIKENYKTNWTQKDEKNITEIEYYDTLRLVDKKTIFSRYLDGAIVFLDKGNSNWFVIFARYLYSIVIGGMLLAIITFKEIMDLRQKRKDKDK